MGVMPRIEDWHKLNPYMDMKTCWVLPPYWYFVCAGIFPSRRMLFPFRWILKGPVTGPIRLRDVTVSGAYRSIGSWCCRWWWHRRRPAARGRWALRGGLRRICLIRSVCAAGCRCVSVNGVGGRLSGCRLLVCQWLRLSRWLCMWPGCIPGVCVWSSAWVRGWLHRFRQRSLLPPEILHRLRRIGAGFRAGRGISRL